MKFEAWHEEFNIYIQCFRDEKWIPETIATIPFDSESPEDRKEKAELARIMVDALNAAFTASSSIE